MEYENGTSIRNFRNLSWEPQVSTNSPFLADKPLAAWSKQILQRQNPQRRKRRCPSVNADDNTNQARTRGRDKLPADNEPGQKERTVRPHKDRNGSTCWARNSNNRRYYRRGYTVRIRIIATKTQRHEARGSKESRQTVAPPRLWRASCGGEGLRCSFRFRST